MTVSRHNFSLCYFITLAVLILWILRYSNDEYMSTKKRDEARPDNIKVGVTRHEQIKEYGAKSENKSENVKRPVEIGVDDEYVYVEYERYVTNKQTECHEVSRCGSKGDSGYDICVDSAYKPKQPCLVYSFGSNFVFDFERGVLEKFKCEIHTFDPSRPIEGHNIPSGVNFHLIGLSGNDHTNKLGWGMKTLSSIREYLNHSTTHLDILKIDIEGFEWHALPQIISSVSSTDITQMVVELHFGRELKTYRSHNFNIPKTRNWGSVEAYTQLVILKQLKQYGFQIFSYQKNPRTNMQLFHSEQQSLFTCYVIALKNTNLL